jgi:hypothetical protein
VNQSEAIILIEGAKGIYTGWASAPVSPQALAVTGDLWSKVLVDVSAAEAMTALLDHNSSGAPFPPTPGQLRQLVFRFRAVGEGSTAPDADQAWEEIQTGIRARGFQQGPPEWSHPCVGSAVTALTWRSLCESMTQMADRAHFMKFYPTIVERFARDATMHPEVRNMIKEIGEAFKMPEIGDAGRDKSNDVEIRRDAYDRLVVGNTDDVPPVAVG